MSLKHSLICPAITQVDANYLVLGSELRNCSECNGQVYASPASIELANQDNILIVCLSCALQQILSNTSSTSLKPQSVNFNELKDFLKTIE